MWTRKTFIASIALLALFVSSMSLASAEPPFSVSPGEFTARDVPPMGEPYTIPQTIIVWNRDNVERLIFVTSEIPPENAVSIGYEPIPNENWVRPIPSSFIISENSYAEVQISIDMPRWENLTSQRWEVWIAVERQPILIDNTLEPVVLRPTVRMKIETTENLPSPTESEGINYLVFLALGLVVAIIIISAWIWSQR